MMFKVTMTKIQQWERFQRFRQKFEFKILRSYGVILLYHRVTDIDSDPQLLCVSPQNFADHLEILQRSYRPLRLQQLSQRISQGRIPARTVIITFDDGYADNLSQAKPLLLRYNIPATVFVTSGGIDRVQEFWWDDLERILLQPGVLPEHLTLRINDKCYSWKLGHSAHYPDTEYQNYCDWHVNQARPTPRHELYDALCTLLRPLSGQKRQEILRQLAAWAGVETRGRATHRTLTVEEVRELATGGLIEVGAHGISHPLLAALPKDEQSVEIQQSKQHLESLLGQPVNSFSYPYGTRSDYTADTVTLVRDSGFTCACSNFLELVHKQSDRFQLPRFIVRNWPGEKFASFLDAWFCGAISDEYLTS